MIPKNLSLKAGIAFVVIFMLMPLASALAANINVDSNCSLVNALLEATGGAQVSPLDSCEDVNHAQANSITLTADITMTANLPSLRNSGVGTITINGGNHTISGASSSGTPTYRMFSFYGHTVTINNLTLTKAKNAETGGVMLVHGSSNITLNNVTISDSVVTGSSNNGGGIAVQIPATLTVNNSTLSGNTATDTGGGIYNSGGTVTISNTTLSGNSAVFGSALASVGGTVTIKNSTIKQNTATGYGYGALNFTSNSKTAITNSTISNNISVQGSLYFDSGTLTVSESTFSGNKGTYGGVIFSHGGTSSFCDTIFANNRGTGNGGVIYNDGGTLTICNSTLHSNTSTEGGVLYNSSGDVTMQHVTVTNNSTTSTAGTSGGLHLVGGTLK